MIISHKYKFIFIKTRKTAGTSIEAYLSDYCSSNDILTPIFPPVERHQARNYQGRFNPIREIISNFPDQKEIKKTVIDWKHSNKFYNHIPANKVKLRVLPKIWNSYFKFCVERNPWDKTLSYYHHMNHKYGEGKWSFDQYLDSQKICLNCPLYMDQQQTEIIVDEVIKYESLNEELAEIFQKLEVPFNGDLTIKAKSEYRKNRTPYQEIYTKEQKEKVAKLFQKEISLHDYRFY